MFSAQSITDRAKQIENIADQQMQKKIDAIRNERLQSVTQTKASGKRYIDTDYRPSIGNL